MVVSSEKWQSRSSCSAQWVCLNLTLIIKLFRVSMNEFFDLEALNEGICETAKLIAGLHTNEESLVVPNVQPGFLRKALPTAASDVPHSLSHIRQFNRDVFHEGTSKRQSRRFYSDTAAVSMTNIFAQMFANTFNSPAFMYAASPTHTELQNIVVDWTAHALGLPNKFLLKNIGGGIINNSTSESLFVSVHAAKHRKMKELGIEGNDARVLKFVGYYTEFSYQSSTKALAFKDIYHKRAVPCRYSEQLKNFEVDLKVFEMMLEKDVTEGLTPFWLGASYGASFSASIDLSESLVEICQKYRLWLNLDAAYLGSTWLLEECRPKSTLLQKVDSLQIHFGKQMLSGDCSSMFYVGDKKEFTSTMGATNFSFYKNDYSEEEDVVDYKDWIIGLGRKSGAFKLFYIYQYYGLEKLRLGLRNIWTNVSYLLVRIKENFEDFHLFCEVFGLIGLQIKDKAGKTDKDLTKKVCAQVSNVMEGTSVLAEFKEHSILRLIVGNFDTQIEDIRRYFDKILAVTRQVRAQL